jgi:hypothetical protein
VWVSCSTNRTERHPALRIDPLVCAGFWDKGPCRGADPIVVRRGSAGAAEDPSVLALFPNNPPAREPTIVETSH